MGNEQPARYRIEGLLAQGEQPFTDLDDEELRALGKGIGRGALAVPIVVSEDGTLVDGHQRLKAMLTAGRTYVDAGDVRVLPGVTRENALEWAVRLNVQRRHLSVAEKAEVARKLQVQRRWSQRKIAAVFGVSQPAVAKWLSTAEVELPDLDDEPRYVVGLDGKSYPAEPRPPAQEPRAPRHPWTKQGRAYKAAAALLRLLNSETNASGLSRYELANASSVLTDVIAGAENMLSRLADALPGQLPELEELDDEEEGT